MLHVCCELQSRFDRWDLTMDLKSSDFVSVTSDARHFFIYLFFWCMSVYVILGYLLCQYSQIVTYMVCKTK